MTNPLQPREHHARDAAGSFTRRAANELPPRAAAKASPGSRCRHTTIDISFSSHHLRLAPLGDHDLVSAVCRLDILFPCIERFHENLHCDISLNVAGECGADRQYQSNALLSVFRRCRHFLMVGPYRSDRKQACTQEEYETVLTGLAAWEHFMSSRCRQYGSVGTSFACSSRF